MKKQFQQGIHEIIKERGKTHGNYEDMAELSQALKRQIRFSKNWGAMTPAQREALEMICVKIARICVGNPHEPDHWTDLSAYPELARGIL
jgi:hypothetical protein